MKKCEGGSFTIKIYHANIINEFEKSLCELQQIHCINAFFFSGIGYSLITTAWFLSSVACLFCCSCTFCYNNSIGTS